MVPDKATRLSHPQMTRTVKATSPVFSNKGRIFRIIFNDDSNILRQRTPSGFLLKAHEIIELQVPGRDLCDGGNTLAFEMPKFPHERDSYVYIYDLEVDLVFGDD